MFYNCTSLTSLDLSNFNKIKLVYMDYMFSYCGNLSFLDISSFKTPKVQYSAWMFYDCKSLTSLNFPNFNANRLKEYFDMFYNCTNLKYINFSNTYDNSKLNNIFKQIRKEIIVCINETKAPKLYSKLIELNSTSINCSYIPPCRYYHYYDNEEKNVQRVKNAQKNIIN